MKNCSSNRTHQDCLIILVLAVSLSFFSFPLHAQQTESEQPAAVEQPAGPQPIPASKISILAEQTNNTIRSLRDRPAPQQAIETVANEINDVLERYETMLAQTEKSLGGTISFREFEDLERRSWRVYAHLQGRVSAADPETEPISPEPPTATNPAPPL